MAIAVEQVAQEQLQIEVKEIFKREKKN